MLADALKNQTYQNYELIVVDDMASRQKLVWDYLKNEGINVTYVGPSKKPCFPELGYNIVNALNTGILKSTGDVVVFTSDYQWYPPNSLEKWLKWEEKFKEKTCVVCGGDMYTENRKKNFQEFISIWDRPWKGTSLENDCVFDSSWMPEYFEMAYTGYSYALLEAMNGLPECCDAFAASGQFAPIIDKLTSVGGKIITDPENKMQMINHRLWEPVQLWHQSKRSPSGSTEYIPRENCFNLREHVRGDLSKYEREPIVSSPKSIVSVPVPSIEPKPVVVPPVKEPEIPKKNVIGRVWIYERRPYTAKEDADAILQEFDDVATMLNIPHFLFHGTCVGLYLDGTYCATDPDIDVGVICSTEQRDVLFHHLFERGYIRNDTEQNLDSGNWTFIKNELRLDVYFGKLPMDFLKSFDSLEYKGRRYNLPSPIEDYLVMQYGADWRTQKYPGLIMPEELVKDCDIYEVGEGVYYAGEGFHKIPPLYILIINRQKLVKLAPFGAEEISKVYK